jgi:hypothetical protein
VWLRCPIEPPILFEQGVFVWTVRKNIPGFSRFVWNCSD